MSARDIAVDVSDRGDITVRFDLAYVAPGDVAAREAEGWRVVSDMADCHHGAYSVLMRRDEPPPPRRFYDAAAWTGRTCWWRWVVIFKPRPFPEAAAVAPDAECVFAVVALQYDRVRPVGWAPFAVGFEWDRGSACNVLRIWAGRRMPFFFRWKRREVPA